ncbi:glutathione S-transferase T3 [Trifolium repens]|nr:glutathione S-transferase T3 [Trifolium repens]
MSHGVQMDNTHIHLNDKEHETPQFCTQDGLETINLGEEVGITSVVNTSKTRFQPKEDELLIQSWLNVSKDSIDKKGDSFWKRIDEAYNDHHTKNFPERKSMALKGRWHKKNNPSVQKFESLLGATNKLSP